MWKTIVAATTLAAFALGSQAAELSVQLSGANYQGAPEFEVLVDGKVVGKGSVGPEGTVRTYSFDVPDDRLTPGAVVAVSLTNDLFEGRGRDRNLFVHSITVGTERFDSSSISVTRDGRPSTGDFSAIAPIYSGGDLAFITLPDGTESEPATNAPVTDKEVALNSEAATEKVCEFSGVLKGFENGAQTLTVAQRAQVEAWRELLMRPDCELELTGYGSVAGAPALNLAVSRARADAVAAYFTEIGLSFRLVTVNGGGGTSQFGPMPADNRVVVIDLN